MAFDFPNTPVIGDEYSSGGATYTWDGVTWDRKPQDLTGTYVEIVGDTMLGPLILPMPLPTDTYEATTKQYVDASIAAAALYQGTWQVAANIPDLTPAVANPLNSYSWIATTVDPNVGEVAPAGLPGIGGQTITSSDNIIWNGNTSVYERVRTPSAISGEFVPIIGGTMTGALTITDAAAAPLTIGGLNKRVIQFDNCWIAQSNGSGGQEGKLQIWTNNGGYSDAMCLETTIQSGAAGIRTGGRSYFGGVTVNGANVSMGDGAGIHWGTTSAVTGQHDLSEGICLYGYGSTSQFGWNITSGTLNHIVQNAGNKHNFIVGTENKLQIAAVGITQPTVTNDKNGYFLGDRYHGLYFRDNKLVFTEYHDYFVWRRQTSGTTGGAGDQRMTLVGGNLDAQGTVSSRAVIDRSMLEDYPDLEPFAAGEDPADSEIPQRGVNLGKLLLHALDEIKALKSEIASLKEAR